MSTNTHCAAQMLQIVHHIKLLLLQWVNPHIANNSTGISRLHKSIEFNANNAVYVTNQSHFQLLLRYQPSDPIWIHERWCVRTRQLESVGNRPRPI